MLVADGSHALVVVVPRLGAKVKGWVRQRFSIDGEKCCISFNVIHRERRPPGVGGGSCDDKLGAEKGGMLLKLVIVDDTCGLVESVRHGLKVDGCGTDTLLCCHEPVSQVATMGEVQAHDAVMWAQEGGVDLEVGWGSRQGLNVDAPLIGVKLEEVQGTLL